MAWKELDDLDSKVADTMLKGSKGGDEWSAPNRQVDTDALSKARNDAFDAFKKKRNELAELLEKYENAVDALKNGVKRVAAIYDGFKFGRDAKKKDDAKKIEQAHKMYAAFFTKGLKELADDEKDVDELQKHLVHLRDYKGPGK
jgi:hypothetical protein